MKTKIFVYGLLVFLPSTNSLSENINSNIQTVDPNDYSVFVDHNTGYSTPINSEPKNYWRFHVEPSWDVSRNALIDWAGNEVPREFRICSAVMPRRTSDGRLIDGCGDEVPNPFGELIIQDFSDRNQAWRDNQDIRNLARRARAATGLGRQRNRSANG